MKNILDGISIRLDITKEKNSDLEDIARKTNQNKMQRVNEI